MRVIFIKKYKNYVKGNIDEIEDMDELNFLLSTKTVEKYEKTTDLSSNKLIADNSKLKKENLSLKKELEGNKKKIEELEKELEAKTNKVDKK